MAYGLKVFTDSGFLVIDDNFRNYEVKATFQLSCPSTLDLSPYGEGAIVMVKNENDSYFLRSALFGTNIGFALVDTSDNPASGIISVAVLQMATSADNTPYGLRVFNSAGDLCFTSGRNYMRLRDSYTVTSITQTYASIYIGITNPWVVINPISAPITYYVSGGGSNVQASLLWAAFFTYNGYLYYKLTSNTYPRAPGSNVLGLPVKFQLGV